VEQIGVASMASISPDNEQFLEKAVAAGRFADRGEALDAAIRLLRRREELIDAVDSGVDQLNAGRYTEYDELELDRFVADIKAKAASSRKA
jgi:Arc/MetJ-type ribon-helix-helix transcriptional regulator